MLCLARCSSMYHPVRRVEKKTVRAACKNLATVAHNTSIRHTKSNSLLSGVYPRNSALYATN